VLLSWDFAREADSAPARRVTAYIGLTEGDDAAVWRQRGFRVGLSRKRQVPDSITARARKPSSLYKKTPMSADRHKPWSCGPLSMWLRRIVSDSCDPGRCLPTLTESISLRCMGHGSIISSLGWAATKFSLANAEPCSVHVLLCGDATKSPPIGA
jgi:hypothetical protein